MVSSYRVTAQLAIAFAGILIGFVLGSADGWRLSRTRVPDPYLPPLPCNNSDWPAPDVDCLMRAVPQAAAKADALVIHGRTVRVAANWTGASDAGNVPSVPNAWWLRATRSPVPELPPLPCKEQSWTNADRGCLTWTAPVAGTKPEARDLQDTPILVETDDTGSMASAADTWRPNASPTPVPDLPPLPCNMQNWTEADRACLSWTAPLMEAKAEGLKAQDRQNAGDTIR
jgi:hypothetical protein